MTNAIQKDPPTEGFFVDWNGDTRKVEAPGDGYTCEVKDRGDYIGVDVLDSEGFVTHEATYYPSIEAIAAVGCTVQLHESAKPKAARVSP